MDLPRANDELHRLPDMQSIMEALPGYVMVLDRDHRLIYINRLAVGLTMDGVIGTPVYAFLPRDAHDVARQALEEAFRTGAPTRYESKGMGDGGAIAWYSSFIGPLLTDGEVVAVTLASEDITERKLLEEQLTDVLGQQKRYADLLEQKNRLLAEENAERERNEQLLRRQQEALRAMSAPIIQAWEGVLVLPVIGALDAGRAQQMMEKLLGEIARTRARYAVLDLTGVDDADASTAAHLYRIVRATRLLGSRCLVSGISPTVAQTMVDTQSQGEGIETFGLLQDALRHALFSSGAMGAKQAVVKEPKDP